MVVVAVVVVVNVAIVVTLALTVAVVVAVGVVVVVVIGGDGRLCCLGHCVAVVAADVVWLRCEPLRQ